MRGLMVLVVATIWLLSGCASLTPGSVGDLAAKVEGFSAALEGISETVELVDDRAGSAVQAVSRTLDGVTASVGEARAEIAANRESIGSSSEDPYSTEELLKLLMAAAAGGFSGFFGTNRFRDGRRRVRGEPIGLAREGPGGASVAPGT